MSENMSIGKWISKQITGLRPPNKEERAGVPKQNIFKALRSVTAMQWITFICGWLAWTFLLRILERHQAYQTVPSPVRPDPPLPSSKKTSTIAYPLLEYYSSSLALPGISWDISIFSTHTITQSITFTLLFRSLGALIFGLCSDRYGRKWPLVICLYLIVALQIGSSFCNTFQQFLACRSVFGIGMGGVWGMASATALESLPVELRGLGSGILQQGYAIGYLVAAVINLTLVPHSKHSWRTLFWVAAGVSFFAGTFRAVLPESPLFLRAKREREEAERLARERGVTPVTLSAGRKTRIFLRETGVMLKHHWKLSIYCVLLMTGFNFLSHGSQDLYPTYITDNKLLSSNLATKATIIGNCGAVAGGAIAGMVSQRLGRRLTMMLFILSIGCFIPLWVLPTTFSPLAAGAFCVQFGVQGAWGVIPIQLAEMSPPAFRATFPGLVYQLGNMVSSASSQIEATGGDHLKTVVKGKVVPDYAKVQAILLGSVAAFTFIIIAIGPEKHGSHFENHVLAFEEGGGEDNAYVHQDETVAATSERKYAGGSGYSGPDEKIVAEEERLEKS